MNRLLAGLILLFSLSASLKAQEGRGLSGLWAICYGRSSFSAKAVFIDEEKDSFIPFAWLFYVLQYNNKWILIDCGFRNQEYVRLFKISWRDPLELLAELSLKPEQIDLVIITHAHFDHAGCVSLFPQVQIVITRKAYQDAINRAQSLAEKKFLQEAGRFIIFSGEYRIEPELRIEEISGHAPGSAVVYLEKSLIIFSGDEAYLKANWTQLRSNGTVFDVRANQAFLKRLNKEADKYLILSMHDPDLVPAAQHILKLR